MSMMINPYRFAAVGVGGWGSHRYWRLFINTNHGDATGIIASELEFRGTAGGADLVPVLSGYTGVIYSDDNAVSNQAWKVFDNDNLSSWFADSGPTNQFVGYDFGVPTSVAEALIKTDGTSLTRIPKSCSIEYSDDGVVWTAAESFVIYNNLLAASYVAPLIVPAAGEHLFWRLFCVDNNGGSSFVGTGDIEFRATVGGADQGAELTSNNGGGTGRVIGSNIGLAGNEGYRAFDSSTSSWWAGGATTNQWIAHVFPEPVGVAEVALTAATGLSATNLNRQVNNARIEWSDDAVTWTTVATAALGTWTSGQTKTITI